MDFTLNQAGGAPVVSLRGSFTFKDHHGFRAVLDALTAGKNARRVLDLSGITFLDSAALGMLLIAEDETTAAGATLILRNPSPQITRLFELSAMDALFHIEIAERIPVTGGSQWSAP